MLNLHMCTVAHNALPFLKVHIDVLTRLTRPWTWSICEGVTPCPWAGKITEDMHNHGLSTDGTHEYLRSLAQLHPYNVKLYRSDTYLTEKFQMMLADVKDEESVAIQLDCDEIWTPEQIEHIARMFESNSNHAAAWFYDRYFVGPKLCLARGNGNSAGNMNYEWIRAWRWTPECKYVRHDPPQVTTPHCGNIAMPPCNVFTREETAGRGLVFNHYAFILPEQVQFKETRYGFKGALDGWRRLQEAKQFPVDIHDYLPWLGHGMVERAPDEHCWKPAQI